jgi:hypothetical protein
MGEIVWVRHRIGDPEIAELRGHKPARTRFAGRQIAPGNPSPVELVCLGTTHSAISSSLSRHPKTKKTRRGVPSQRQMPSCEAALPISSGLRQLKTRPPRSPCGTRRRVFFGALRRTHVQRNDASSGREKGACDGLRRHPLIDPIFGSARAPYADLLPTLSASFAGRNLHLVISTKSRDPAAGSPLFNCLERPLFYRRPPASSSDCPRAARTGCA